MAEHWPLPPDALLTTTRAVRNMNTVGVAFDGRNPLPVLVAGTWLGLKLYGRLDEAGFRRIVLLLLLLSGCLLVIQPLRQ